MVKDYTYHKEKMLLCKQVKKGVSLQAEQADWLKDTDEEIDEQELEAHYSFMAKIQEVLPVDSRSNVEPLEKDDSNVIPNSSNMRDNDNQADQNDDKRVAIANLIENLKLDIDENKKIQKQLKKASTSLTQELKKYKSTLRRPIELWGNLNAQLKDKNITIIELKKLIEKCKGKSMKTKFDKPSVVRQPNALRIPKPSVLGKPTPFSDSLERKSFKMTKSVTKTNVSDGLSKPVTTQILPQTTSQAGNPNQDLKDKEVIDSRCSRHMTGNRSYLTDYEEIDEGFVAFKGNSKGGKITKKSKIRTGKLDFKDMYFVKKLKFNLFSVSQMCDKKNSVLFTDTACVVLSPDFKLTDESHVLLKVPRKDNMYNVDLKNVYTSCIEQFWRTAKAKNINGEAQIHAKVDGKKVIISEVSIRRDLRFEDEEELIISQMKSYLNYLHSCDEVVNEEMDDSLERATTTVTSLDAKQDKGNISKTQSKATPNEPSSPGTSSGGGLRHQDTMGVPLFRLGLRIDEDVFGVNDQDDTLMFDADKDLQGEEVVEKEVTGKDTSRPKETKIVMQEPSETTTPTSIVSSQQPLKVHEKGKGIMVEEPLKMKKKDQISFDKQEAQRLQAEFDEEERLAREKNKANNKIALKNKSFADIQDLFNNVMKRVNMFVDMDTEVVESSKKTKEIAQEGSSKRARDELEQEIAKKQRIEDENESAKLKRCLEIVLDDEDDVTIDVTP
nr:ribonuclease H-like domain-containing protein [Tanacetum cinerariifolium]